ncbi:uncharacterized protein [Dipodomys merriami]|uniref:uncharacterized protein isoform X2 n=1 Tax=Dipodomys merriami TaxID=94247 RepID=UPI003855AE7D
MHHQGGVQWVSSAARTRAGSSDAFLSASASASAASVSRPAQPGRPSAAAPPPPPPPPAAARAVASTSASAEEEEEEPRAAGPSHRQGRVPGPPAHGHPPHPRPTITTPGREETLVDSESKKLLKKLASN